MVTKDNTEKDLTQYSLGSATVGAMQDISHVHATKAAFGAPNTRTCEWVQV